MSTRTKSQIRAHAHAAPRPTERSERTAERRMDRLAHLARGKSRFAIQRARHALRRPAVGAAAAGGAVLFAAGLWGASEAAVGALAAYGVYRMLTGRRRGGEGEERDEADR